MDVFAQKLHALGWRDLGLLLVQLLRPLTDTVPVHNDTHWMPWIRCLLALSGTITHMHTLRESEHVHPGPVNPEFVAKMFAAIKCSIALVRQHAEYAVVAPIVFKCVSCVLAPDHCDPKHARFAPNAVLDGLIAPCVSPNDRHATKRRRITSESFLGLLADTLSDSSAVRAHTYVVRILRARNSAVVSRNTNTAADVRLVRALCDLGLKLCASDTAADETYAGSVFACIRDTMDRVDALSSDTPDLPMHVEATAQMLLALSALFRPYVTRVDPVSLYAFCAEKRLRCYQWAALCHAATWISGFRTAPKPAEALAECSRLCWIQITDNTPADVRIWSLLLSESLGHIALCTKPPKPPLFMASLDAQTLVFAALAPLLARITDILPNLASNKVAHPLVLASLRTCERILRLISPHAASMGLFRPASQCADVVREEGAYRRVSRTLDAYVFRPTLLSRDEPAQDVTQLTEEHSTQPKLSVERVREESEEIGREIVLGAVFDSIVAVASVIAEPDVDHSVHSLAFRALMHWISAFTKSARDNAGAQARQLESQKRINIGVVGDKTRMLQSATDWSRLQRFPVVRHRQLVSDDSASDSSAHKDSVRRTYKPVAAQAIRLFAALSLWPVLGNTCQSVLERCLIWSDTEATTPYSAKQASCFCTHLKNSVSDRTFENLAFSSLQILASILGVRSHLFARELRLLRLPHLQVRSHSPQSSEAMMQVAMKTGICQLLLEPGFLVRCVDGVRAGRVIDNPLVLCSGQMWLDMVGNVVRHSLFRTYAGLAYSTKDTAAMPVLPFTAWWSLALASSTRCLLAVLDTDQNVDHIRLACILPSHLVSWHLFIPISDSSIRSFVNSPTSNADLDRMLGDPHRFKSIISVVYFLACNLWRESAILDQEHDKDSATLCRDVWGIASDSLHLLQRMLQHAVARRAFVDLGLLDELVDVVCDIVARQNVPRLILRILKVLDLPNDEPAPDPLQSMLLKISEDLDLVSESDEAAHVNTDSLNPDDVVEKLLHVTTLHRKPVAKQRTLNEYYSPEILARLWTTFIDEILELPVRIALVAQSKHDSLIGRQTEVLEWMDDKDGVLFRTLAPLLAVKEHLSRPSALWQAVEAAAPLECLATAVMSAHSAMPRTSVSVALVLPELVNTKVSPNGQRIVSIVLNHLVCNLNNDDGTSAAALMFMAWRQRTLIEQHVKQCAVRLQRAKNEMLDKLTGTLPLIGPQGLDLILCGTDMQNHMPIRTSLALLSQHSQVFRAMFLGSFSEAHAVQSGVRQFELHDSHTTLMGLVSVLHECTTTNEPSAEFDVHHIVRVLALAIFYDARPAIILLVWRLCEKYDDISVLSDDLLNTLGAMFGENWALYLENVDCKDVCCLLSSVMVLHLDRIDVLGAIEFHVPLFIDSIFATLLVAATAVLAQQIGSEQGPDVASGPSAVSNPNVNNGQQFQNSLLSSGNEGGNVFEGLTGNTFNSLKSNTGISDNNFVNPSQTHVSGNQGSTTNGEGNHIGDFFDAGGFVPFHKRDAVFNNYGHGHGYPTAFVGGYAPQAVYAHPAYAPVYAHPAYAPVYSHPAYVPARPVAVRPAGHVNHNEQNASIVQNQA
ncbi:hypothetical protein IW147_005661 [Coemansia sp. RSA 720]|nr:hypothetical protein IW147_005661 [Coemansia sp. RSA 720]